jgi:hypothetical protein
MASDSLGRDEKISDPCGECNSRDVDAIIRAREPKDVAGKLPVDVIN